MAAVFGSISEFVFESEDITEWIERLEQWFIANGLENNEGRKKALLLSNVGARGYKLIRSLAQNKPTDKSYDELKDLMIEHLNPKPNEIAQRYVFYKRDRRNGETVKDYVAALRKLSEHCNFADKLEDHLRDKFVCGLNDERVQQKLLATQNLTLKIAVENAVAMEAAVRSAKQIHGVEVSQINKLGGGHSGNKFGPKWKGKYQGKFNNQVTDNSNRNVSKCGRCGETSHSADSCPFKDRKCHGCKKFGHAKAMCRTRGINYEGIVEGEENSDLVEGLNALDLYKFSVVVSEDDEMSEISECEDYEFEEMSESSESFDECLEIVEIPTENEDKNEELEMLGFGEEIVNSDKILNDVEELIEVVELEENCEVFEVENKDTDENVSTVTTDFDHDEVGGVKEVIEVVECKEISDPEVLKGRNSEIIEVMIQEIISKALAEVNVQEINKNEKSIQELIDEKSLNEDEEIVTINKLGDEDMGSNDPFIVTMKLNEKETDMELDTGSAVTVCGTDQYNELGGEPLTQSRLKLKTCTGEIVRPKGTGYLKVEYGRYKLRLPITVVDGPVPILLGRNWLKKIRLDWNAIFSQKKEEGEDKSKKTKCEVSPASAEMHKLEEGKVFEHLKIHYPEVFRKCLKKNWGKIP